MRARPRRARPTEFTPAGANPAEFTPTEFTTTRRNIAMQTMNETLARDRMRELRQRAREAELARQLAAQRRWHRVSRYARAAERRHAVRVSRVTSR